MGVLICRGCKRETNTAVSNAYSKEPYGVATECFAAYVDGEWVKGCSKKESVVVTEFFKKGKVNLK